MTDTVTILLAGDPGAGLSVLTDNRAKAAVPFGGEYRVIDFTLSNCLHSGLRRVLVFTQYRSHSLQKHLRDGWSIFNPELGEYVTPIPPQMRIDGGWFRGTADAIAQNRQLLERSGAKNVLIARGDHVYRMDYAALIAAHEAAGTGFTVACVDALPGSGSARPPVSIDDAGGVQSYGAPTAAAAAEPGPGGARAMGVYVFALDLLMSLLDGPPRTEDDYDLEDHLVPAALAHTRAHAYRFGGRSGRVSQDRFWSDLDTVDAYFRSQMSLLEPVPPLDLYQTGWEIWSYPGKNPPARTVGSRSGNEGIFVNSIVSNGTVIVGGAVSRSVLGPRVRVEDSATIERCVVLNGVRVGAGAELRGCIVDKRANIAPRTRIGFDPAEDRARFPVTDGGIVLVPADYTGDSAS